MVILDFYRVNAGRARRHADVRGSSTLRFGCGPASANDRLSRPRRWPSCAGSPTPPPGRTSASGRWSRCSPATSAAAGGSWSRPSSAWRRTRRSWWAAGSPTRRCSSGRSATRLPGGDPAAPRGARLLARLRAGRHRRGRVPLLRLGRRRGRDRRGASASGRSCSATSPATRSRRPSAAAASGWQRIPTWLTPGSAPDRRSRHKPPRAAGAWTSGLFDGNRHNMPESALPFRNAPAQRL